MDTKIVDPALDNALGLLDQKLQVLRGELEVFGRVNGDYDHPKVQRTVSVLAVYLTVSIYQYRRTVSPTIV